MMNVLKGHHKVRHFPCGAPDAPGVFERSMDIILAALSVVAVHLDDILMAGETGNKHERVRTKELNCQLPVENRTRNQRGKARVLQRESNIPSSSREPHETSPYKANFEIIRRSPLQLIRSSRPV